MKLPEIGEIPVPSLDTRHAGMVVDAHRGSNADAVAEEIPAFVEFDAGERIAVKARDLSYSTLKNELILSFPEVILKIRSLSIKIHAARWGGLENLTLCINSCSLRSALYPIMGFMSSVPTPFFFFFNR